MSELSKNDYLPKGVLSMSRGRTLEAHKGNILEPQLRAKIDKEDDGLFIADEERVQGLSGNNLESKEDVSEERLGSQTDPVKDQSGLTRCAMIPEEGDPKEDEDYRLKKVIQDPEEKKTEMTECQKMAETRYNKRIMD
jgi:hypothetical protein